MKNKVLSCLGRRKRDCSQADADSGCGNGAAGPAARRDHRVGKLPRDEAESAGGGRRASPGCFETPAGLDGGTEAVRLAVSRGGEAAGPSDAAGLETGTGEVSEEPKPEREDNASDPPARAMEDQPLGGDDQGGVVEVAGTRLLAPGPDQPPGRGPSVPDYHTAAKMTKTDCDTVPCPPEAPGGQNNCCPGDTESPRDSDQAPPGPPGAPSFPGTIPKLIITRDPSPTRSRGTPAQLSVGPELGTGSCLEPHADDESPCSDSGCGGSPALMRSPRKLSNSSSIGLSSASSFEESEDDFTGSDIESSLSPARSLCSPDDGTGVSVSFSQHKTTD